MNLCKWGGCINLWVDESEGRSHRDGVKNITSVIGNDEYMFVGMDTFNSLKKLELTRNGPNFASTFTYFTYLFLAA